MVLINSCFYKMKEGTMTILKCIISDFIQINMSYSGYIHFYYVYIYVLKKNKVKNLNIYCVLHVDKIVKIKITILYSCV